MTEFDTCSFIEDPIWCEFTTSMFRFKTQTSPTISAFCVLHVFKTISQIVSCVNSARQNRICVRVQVSMEPSVVLEVENEVSVVAGSRLSQLRCSKDGRDWNTLLPSSVVTAAGSR